MGYSIDPISANCYEGTICLINKLDIRDEELLANAEAKITVAKMALLEETPISDKFDFDHYKAIHKFMFEDLYDWAGQIRIVDISKKGTVFCKAEKIEELANNCFDRLILNKCYVGLPFDEFVDEIVDFYCVTNMLHPFREGNGRTQRAFISQLVKLNGYIIDFSTIDTDELMIATIHSANGITDYLKDIFKRELIKI